MTRTIGSPVRRLARPLGCAAFGLGVVVLAGGRSPGRAAGALSFTDVTVGAGVGNPLPGGHGVMFADADGNGFPDLYVTMNFGPPLADWFFRNVGGSFVEEGAARGIADVDYGSHGGVWADLDGDGDYDLVNGTTYRGEAIDGESNNIFRNDGGVFTDVTPAVMRARAEATRAVLALDMDRDGDLDLFTVSGWLGSGDPGGERNEVYRNDGGFQFAAVSTGALYEAPAGQGATDTDYDGDGDVDVIASNRDGSLNVLRNDGVGGYALVPPASIGIVHTAYSGITMGDVDGDDDLDMVLVGLAGGPFDTVGHLYRNNGNGTFSYIRSFGDVDGYMGGLADLDNDGDLDLVFAGDSLVYLNDGAGRFSPGPSLPTAGIDDPRAVAFADIDRDGDLDMAMAAKHSRNWLIRNDLQMGNWLELKLVSPQGQAGAFGAKAKIYPAGQSAGAPLATREARSNDGYLSQSDPVIHFGLGARSSVDVVVTYVDGSRQTVMAVAANQLVTIDGSSAAPPVPPQPPPPGPPPAPPGPPGPPVPAPPTCVYTVSPTQLTIGAGGGQVTVTIDTSAGCAWTVASGADWLAPSVPSGAGSGPVPLVVAANQAVTARSGVVTVAGTAVTVIQASGTTASLDLNADGIGDVLRYDPSSGMWAEEFGSLTGGFRRVSGLWEPGWTIRAASLDRDGFTDAFLYNRLTGEYAKAVNDGAGSFRIVRGIGDPGWMLHVGDLDADGLSDLVLYDPFTGRAATARLSTSGFTYVPAVWPAGRTVHLADFNGDGRDDVFLYDPSSGQSFRLISDGRGGFYFEGTTVPTTSPPPPGAARVVLANATIDHGDFDGDGRDDVLLYQPLSGIWFVALTRTTGVLLSHGSWEPGWRPYVGDLSGDGRADVLIYEFGTGRWALAIGDGTGGFTTILGQSRAGWTVALVDFNTDGRDDVLAYDGITGDWQQVITSTTGFSAVTDGRWEPGLTVLVR